MRIGYTWKCSSCHGQGKITCLTCNGNCRMRCLHCNGTGRRSTSHAADTELSHALSVEDKGAAPCRFPSNYWNDATKQYSVRYEGKWEFCHAAGCHNGQMSCICAGGKVNCAHCLAAGKVTCSTCNGQGEETCKGTGTLHRIAETECEVTNSLAIHSSDFNDEDRRTTALWDF